MSLGERIAELRKKQNLSQGQLAKAMDISRQAVSKWENDLTAPDTIKLIQLADVLNTEIEYLATGALPSRAPAPIIVNMVKHEDRIVEVEKIVEKPVVHRVIKTKYIRNPIEFLICGILCFALGIFIGLLIG